jgi:hypothetical protein
MEHNYFPRPPQLESRKGKAVLFGMESILREDKTLLVIGQQAQILGESSLGTGLLSDVNGAMNVVTLNMESDSIDKINSYQNTTHDYIYMHYLDMNGMYDDDTPNFDFLNLLESLNITCNTFIVDFLGEGHEMVNTMRNNPMYNLFNQNTTKILSPFGKNHNDELKIYMGVDYDFFSSQSLLTGISIFCSPHNGMMHNHLSTKKGFDVMVGMEWNTDSKNILFECMNGDTRIHRHVMVNEIRNSELSSDDMILTYVGGDDDIPMGEFDEPLVSNKQLLDWEDSVNGNRFGLFPRVMRETYISVISESSIGPREFDTEKISKPFYGLQFPIIYGYDGIVEKLRLEGFDMFDDIINHSYDITPHTEDMYQRSMYKSKLIVEELIRLSKLDISKLYEENKDRFISNQNKLYEYTVANNTFRNEYMEFIFGDEIKITADNKIFNKLYLK